MVLLRVSMRWRRQLGDAERQTALGQAIEEFTAVPAATQSQVTGPPAVGGG